MYWRDLRAFLSGLDERGKLYRFAEPIDKDSELMSLYRVQMRGVQDAQRKVLVFEHVTNAAGQRYDMRVAAGVYGVSDDVLALGVGCPSPDAMLEHWHHAVEEPIAPVLVERGPVHEEVHVGNDIQELGLDELPVPVEEPGFSQMIRTGLPMITRDPESGITNVGTYNGFFRDRDRLVAAIGGIRDTMRRQWATAHRRGEELPLAIVIGATPNVMLVGSASLPYGTDELAVAGGLAGAPVEMVRCKTIPLEVPATAEIVIEGLVSTSTFEPRFAFGEYPGYLNLERNNRPVMRVTAITHRADALFTPVQVGFPPSETNAVWGFCNAAVLYDKLRYRCGLPVAEVYFPQMGGGNDFCIVRLEEGAGATGWQVLQATSGLWPASKFVVAVDYDINPRDPDLLVWALSFRVRPERDCLIQPGRPAGLDPSFGVTGSSKGKIDSAGHPRDYFKILIDATLKGAYPPVALPAREYMERALARWRQHADLPVPEMRTPWHGYSLGHWSEEDQRLADVMVAGDYKAVGRVAAELQEDAERVLARQAP
jgi:4-hydroxy-3-polyprenylbenzoate decarboxylase